MAYNVFFQKGLFYMKRDFFLCGALGWCMEIFWTGLHSLLNGQGTMMGKTSLLMFPIYGCAAVISPLYKYIASFPILIRGSLYAAGFFITEFFSGIFLKYLGICPWDYSHTPFHFCGVIRLDYAPVWFAAGLFFEKILTKSS